MQGTGDCLGILQENLAVGHPGQMYTPLYTHLISATLCDLQAVLRQHSDALRQATLSILKTETLTGQELKDIMAQHPPQDPPHGQVS